MQRKYAYRRKLPHYQWTDKTYFITFATRNREILSHYARDFVLETCLVGNGKQYQLHAVVVMPDHVHLGLTPLADEDGPISFLEILQEIKAYRRIGSINTWDAKEVCGSRSLSIAQCARSKTLSEN